MTQDDIGDVLKNPRPGGVVENGDTTLVIGDNPSGENQVILVVIGGILTDAYPGDEIIDPLGDRVILDRSDKHAFRDDEDHISDPDVAEEVVKNPDEVYQNGPNRVYVKEIRGVNFRA